MLGRSLIPTRKECAEIAVVASIIFVAVYVAIQSTTLSAGQMAIWPPDGIALAMMLGAFRHRPILMLLVAEAAASAAGVILGDPLMFIFLLKIAGGACVYLLYLLLRDHDYAHNVHRTSNIIRLLIFSLLASAAASIIQTYIVILFYKVSILSVFMSDLAAQQVGYSVLTPIFLIMTARPWRLSLDRKQLACLTGILALYAVVVAAVFGQSRYPLLFLLPLALMAVGYTTNIATVACCLLATAMVAIFALFSGHGPTMNMSGTPMDRMLMLQIVLAAITATALPIAALMAEHAKLKQSLVAARVDAEAASEAKSNFLATLSHEIRTPLNGVLGMAQIMALGELDPGQTERLHVIRRSGEALLSILSDVLDLSKIEAGKLTLETIKFDLCETLQATIDCFAPLAAEKGLQFEYDLKASEGVYLGDPTRIRQIVSNLISNALKFTESGAIRISGAYSGDTLTLTVEDTGIGMSAETLDKLFSKFTQADQTTTRRFGGTGLGLAICRELASIMGGTVSVESQEGQGSRFAAILPLTRIGDIEAEKHADIAPAEAFEVSLRVLAAEDNPTNQLVLRTLLEMAGVSVSIVDNGAEAVKLWEREEWDVILMDIRMPVMDGPEATRIIRAREAATGRSRTPIVALTADTMAHQISLHEACGMDFHVAKPIAAGDLFQAILKATQPAAVSEPDMERSALG